jgi:hypothetical protein
LTGILTADEYRKAVNHFVGLVNALSDVVAERVSIDWQLSNIDYGSVLMEFSGYSNSESAVREVVAAYGVATRAAAERQPIPYPASVRSQLEALTGLINGHIKSIEFTTSTAESVVTAPIPHTEERAVKWTALGSVRGRVQTISDRQSLYFNLYDSVFDDAVRCTVLLEQQEMLRDIWGKEVIVTGTVTRNPDTGQPISISGIIDIQVINMLPRDTYKRFRGIVEYDPNDPPSHERIRRLRDDD